jgi:hypothetical protein
MPDERKSEQPKSQSETSGAPSPDEKKSQDKKREQELEDIEKITGGLKREYFWGI